ncbi:MAG TPA: hypothetical protein PLQ13_11180 [Candidatus Krumholzibacteria bacterium]|nr:hypothetical protein [Candidatus Krumholzibacteria bacterium]
MTDTQGCRSVGGAPWSAAAVRCLVAAALAVVVAGLVPLARAEGVLALPDAVGDFQENLVEGELEFPGDPPGGETWLVVKGRLELGTYWSCDTGEVTPWGSEVHLYLGAASDAFVLASAHMVLPPEEGAFEVAVPLGCCLPVPGGTPYDWLATSGIVPFQLFIGCDYGSDPVPCYVHDAGPMTIDAAWLETRKSVATTGSSWGAAKGLYLR